MKLLFDPSLSFKFCARLTDLFPGSQSVRELGIDKSHDLVIWRRAKDSDFAKMAAYYAHPPKVIWLRLGSQPSDFSKTPWRRHTKIGAEFAGDVTAARLPLHKSRYSPSFQTRYQRHQ